MTRTRIALAAAAALAACGGSSPPPARFTLSATGLSPRSLEVMSGTCVTFQNGDAAEHDIAADDATTCPELAQPHAVMPGDTFTACLMQGPKVCAFHDPTRDGAAGAPDAAFAGAIQVDESMDGMPSM